MKLIGWVLGSQFERYITSVDHWVAFGLLAPDRREPAPGTFSGEEADCACGRRPEGAFFAGRGHQHRCPGGRHHLRLL
jgi:hypothetical protein